VYNLRLAPLSNYTQFSICYAMRALRWSLASNGMISRKDGLFLELFTATRWLDVLLCTSGTRWTSPTSRTNHVWASERRKLWHDTEQLTRTPLVLPTDRFSARYSSPELSTILSSLQNFILQTISKSATTTMWPFNTVLLWLYLSVQICLITWR